jgi:hypothetical protein
MGKIRRGGYIFVTWKGDHSPRHVHVAKDGKRICKWDLENNRVMEGKATPKIKDLISELVRENRL